MDLKRSVFSVALFVTLLGFAGAFTSPASAATTNEATASFVASDTTTLGNWQGVYGADGYSIANSSQSIPSYATFAVQPANGWTWAPASSTVDPRALQTGNDTGRIAATWYNQTSFYLDVNLTDANVHQVAVYLLDWDYQGRSETVQVVDAASNTQLDERTISGFTNGIYLVYSISGHAHINITTDSGPNSVVSGVFFATTNGVNVKPGMINLTAGKTQQFTASVTSSTNQNVTWSITPSVGTISASGLYTAPATISTTQTITVTATSAANTTNSSSSVVSLLPGSAVANFVSFDTSTEGNWSSLYGADGYSLANANQKLPSYDPSLTEQNQLDWTWASSTTDPRALQLPGGSSSIAAAWYNPASFSFDVNLADGNQHQVAFYAVDWDNWNRSETIQIQDATTNAILDKETVTKFTSGVYAVWNISGHVKVVVTDMSYPNSVISGLFFGGSLSSANSSSTGSGGTGGSSSTTSSGNAGSTTPAPSPVSVSVTPAAVTLTQGQTHRFSASVQNSTYQSVTWSLSPNVGIMSATGMYTAPASITTAQNVTVSATTVATPSQSSSGVVALAPPAPAPLPISVSVSPTAATLAQGQTQAFSASVQNSTNQSVTWSLSPNVGTISATGVYTAPATITTAQNVTVSATTVATPSQSSISIVALTPPVLPISVSVSPTGVTLAQGQTQAFSASVQNSANQSVIWSLSPNVGTISATGVYAAPATITTAQNVTVSATTVATPSQSSSSVIALAPSTTNPVKDPAGIFDGNGNFSATAYVNEAAAYGTPAMIPERFGNSWTSYHSSISASTLWQPPINYYVNPSNTAETWYYTLGTPQTAAGDFSSSFAQVAYVTNPSVSGSAPGVDGILTLDQSHNLWTGVPQLYWTEYGAGHPDENLSGANSSDPYGTPQQPVAVERAYGASESAGESYMVFQNGEVAMGEGGNSANFPYYFDPFPANFTPTAASVTNNGEFLLVTGWNTSTYQGQLAVIAIGSSQPSGSFWSYEWNENYPGFRNYSLPMFDKLLGVIDLPGMAAPTAVEAVGNWVHDPNAWLPGTSNPGQFPLSTQSNWQCFVNGACASLYDTSGFALVASRYEREVLLINLTPLFNEISQGMFGGSFSQFRANVANTGTGPGQWPPTFAEQPSETPTVVYTMQFNTQVTAISASLYPDDLAFIATDDDTLHVWSTNGIQEGTGTGANASQLYTLSVGNNITRIAHMKHWYPSDSTNGAVRYQYIALSRGDKTVTWIDMSSGTPTVLRVLSDSRLVDPISAEDNNNHGTQSDLLDIADYGASNLKAYRYGPVIEWTESGTPEYGMGPTGTDPFEFEGSYATPTGPFSISGENVP